MAMRNDEGSHVVLGAGPVGRAVAERLIRDGVRPMVLTRSGTAVSGADARPVDLRDQAAAQEHLANAAVIYQCAQPAYHRWTQEFLPLQRAILAAAPDGAVIVAAENMYGYGDVDGPLHEDLPLTANTHKGMVRAQMWNELLAGHEAGRIRATAARASDFYGPGAVESMLGDRFFVPLLAGKTVNLLGDPDALHSVTYVPDMGAVMVRLGAEPDAWGRPWHVPNAPATSIRAIAGEVGQMLGTSPKLRAASPRQVKVLSMFSKGIREVSEMMYQFTDDFVVDHRAFADRFHIEATSLSEGLATTVASHRTTGAAA